MLTRLKYNKIFLQMITYFVSYQARWFDLRADSFIPLSIFILFHSDLRTVIGNEMCV